MARIPVNENIYDQHTWSRSRVVELASARETLIKWLRRQLMGPPPKDGNGDEIILNDPLQRYPAGVLYPVVQNESGLDGASIEDEDDYSNPLESDGNDGREAKSARQGRRYAPPSSVGFSFFIKGSDIKIRTHCQGARYENIADERDQRGRFIEQKWNRLELGDSRDLEFSPPLSGRISRRTEPALSGRAKVDVLWRPFVDGWIVTVSLINGSELTETDEYWEQRTMLSIFEASLSCIVDSGEVGSYPRVDSALLTGEELEIELQYKDRRIYAVGHGAAVDWTVENGRVREIHSDFVPAVEVPLMTADLGGSEESVLSLSFLSKLDFESKDHRQRLEGFVGDYQAWVDGEKSRAAGFDEEDLKTAAGITGRMDRALERMRRGLAFLSNNDQAARAFRTANLAMLKQMVQADKNRELEKPEHEYRWRPFQLAFLLTVLESAADRGDDDEWRDVVDLIWFPTGGGKTEAYLGLMAFVIAWRRYEHGAAGGGTTVLMRYTLRLLTSQQFERAARMISALELIRRGDPDLGREPITAGMWVGNASSPNLYHEAKEILDDAIHGAKPPPKKLVLDKCPWCDAPFDARRNYVASPTRFHFLCRNPNCEFGRNKTDFLPCNVVDEALYDQAPTLLVSTIDKFARLAWTEAPGAFFNSGRPPELIIQDELHLIAGALGSIAGLYEAALDAVINKRGVKPKYIASTATIRLAREQCRALFGREVSIFPPPGLSCDNSYFARSVPVSEKPGRLYVGYFAPLLNRQECMAPLAAALLAAPEICFNEQASRDDLQDAWWTQIVYHGSIKGVGVSHNAFDNEVREYYKWIIETENLHKTASGRVEGDADISPIRKTPRIKELTSRSSPDENRDVFSNLEKTKNDPEHLDVVLATNMISVGLDVSRLALMIVNGQPLTTAEYIQASSRVGRGDAPGIVVANYYRDQARSISHYEDFRAYHEAFYRFVEPNSLTPFTYQARNRALHAALVIALRYTCSQLLPNNGAALFNPADGNVREVIDLLKKRCQKADPERYEMATEHIDRLVRDWRDEITRSEARRRSLKYQVSGKDMSSNRLLINHEDKGRVTGLWATLNSMRNVEDSALIKSHV